MELNLDKIVEDYKDEAFDLLKRLIACESVLDEYKPNSDAPFGKECKKALDTLLAQAEKDGFVTKNVDNYAGHVSFGKGEEILGVLAHLDVVPVKKEEWDTYPFELVFKGDKMFARGALDDKGPLVASYIAMKALKDLGFEPKKEIRLIAGCDEESGSRCLERYLEVERKPEIGFSPDAEFPLIYGEKGMTSYDILGDVSDDVISEFVCGDRYNIVPSKATMKLKLDLKKEFKEFLKENNYQGEIDGDNYISYGRASHGAFPQNGVNAAYIMFEFLSKYSDSKLAKFFKEYYLGDVYGKKLGYDMYDEEMKELTSNLAVVMINDGKLKIGVNCRVPLNSGFEKIREALTKATSKYGYTYEVLFERPRHYVAKDSFLVKTLMNAYKEITKDQTEPITIGGGTYAREIGNAVAFGPLMPGREDVCHIANEYMMIEDFYNAIKVYVKAIYDLTK